MVKRERSVSLPKQTAKRRKRGGRRRRKKQRREVNPPAVPASFACHICTKNHWTVACPRLQRNPDEFPLMDRKKGCWKCAQRGHPSAQCPVKKYHCADCGGLHDTRDCEFDHKSEEWHEFYDPNTQHVFYSHSETREVQWTPPTHRLDVVLWFCPNCNILLPTTVPECVTCHAPRMESKASSHSSSSSSSASSSDNEEEDSDDEASSVSADEEE
ncbi:hypothetical protein TraAM80_03685 [Trypanosoma rangeli]|uniref:CCHC-type domain-containing protein n=1 Tax=Trypanosoma rangeli TaxID=5698 RepID=A0A3R7NIK0_TRYRA|nr:uncharacterized protein TraAM80_03685 [Trypanosoma rangeli]RNF07051.1 hypothetical protein TraAM80_03685 [Trypanosoma rangeli]|eukprot:RNF07051.1 hypothetical protein TraAM80_03685 [Trypanosoma rangeli]